MKTNDFLFPEKIISTEGKENLSTCKTHFRPRQEIWNPQLRSFQQLCCDQRYLVTVSHQPQAEPERSWFPPSFAALPLLLGSILRDREGGRWGNLKFIYLLCHLKMFQETWGALYKVIGNKVLNLSLTSPFIYIWTKICEFS